MNKLYPETVFRSANGTIYITKREAREASKTYYIRKKMRTALGWDDQYNGISDDYEQRQKRAYALSWIIDDFEHICAAHKEAVEWAEQQLEEGE